MSFTRLFSYRANDIEKPGFVRVLSSGFWRGKVFLLKRSPPISWEIANLRRGTSRILAYTKRKGRYRLLMVTAAVLACNFHVDRQVWTVSRSSHWFEIAETTFSDEEWYGSFRLSRHTFDFLITDEDLLARIQTCSKLEKKARNHPLLFGFYRGIQNR